MECFYDYVNETNDEKRKALAEVAAKREISETLNKRDTWKNRSRNFLLRLISDDENGYRYSNTPEQVEPRPRVHLALAFVEQMAECKSTLGLIVEYLRETVSVHEREAESTRGVENVQEDIAQVSVRLTNGQPSDGDNRTKMNPSLQKRGNGLIHEAAKSGRCAVLEKLGILTAENVNYLNSIGEAALHLAAEFEHINDVKILLAAGAQLRVCFMLYVSTFPTCLLLRSKQLC